MIISAMGRCSSVKAGLAHLFEKHFRQRRSGHQRIEHELAFLLFLRRTGAWARSFGQNGPAIPGRAAPAGRTPPENHPPARGGFFDSGSNIQIRRRFGRVGLLGLALCGFRSSCSVQLRFRRRGFFQHRILLQFLLTSAFSSSVAPAVSASDCCSCGASTSDCVKRCDNCKPLAIVELP